MSELIDANVHVRWEQDDDLLPYLSSSWHSRWLIGRGGHTASGLYIQPKYYDPDDPYPMAPRHVPGPSTVNLQAAPNLESLSKDWLEPNEMTAAVIGCYDAALISTYGDSDYPTEVARAVNQWLTDRFLDADPQLFGGITVATQDVTQAVKEIHRAAAHPQMAQIVLPAGTRMPYGHKYYRPIFRAAQECGLAVAIVSGTEGLGTSNMPTPSGWPGTAAEMRVARASTFLAHLTSMVTEGVFVDCPDLTILGFGMGVAWLPPYLWRFDKNWKALRSECPWLREAPSEIVGRHFRFGSAGVSAVEPTAEFWNLMRSVPGEKLLLYASSYPRWDMDAVESSFVLQSSPDDLRNWLRSEGALAAYPRMDLQRIRSLVVG